ncbi:MAG: hypothetical protein N4A71_12920 [Carboxylicivirga sp.]|nr:hypothetical protein [Carboxylicivirga sp.]
MINQLKKYLRRQMVNVRGWSTSRKLLVIESDDWGSIRMPDQSTYQKLLNSGLRVDQCPYMRNDSLASEDDLTALFEVLTAYNDSHGNHPIITGNCVMANPDFEAIRKSNFKEYHFELMTETLKRYPSHTGSFELWKQGHVSGLFQPQFHGREHLNVERWMNALSNENGVVRKAFDHQLFGISKQLSNEFPNSLLQAYAIDQKDSESINSIIEEGLQMFKSTFGFDSKSFIAPNYVWSSINEQVAKRWGVCFIQGQRQQIIPQPDKLGNTTVSHYLGEMNEHEQLYLVRNCYFEPSLYPQMDAVNECLAQIETAFRWHKPAIVCSHRLNFIGFVNEQNRTLNLKSFKKLLDNVVKRWPDVQFISSDELGAIIQDDKQRRN